MTILIWLLAGLIVVLSICTLLINWLFSSYDEHLRDERIAMEKKKQAYK